MGAPTVVAVTSGGAGQAFPLDVSVTHANPDGASTLLAFLYVNNTAAYTPACTYGGVPMTLIPMTGSLIPASQALWCWYLNGPVTGSADVDFSANAFGPDANAYVVSIAGADPANPIGVAGEGSANTTYTQSLTATTAAGLVISIVAGWNTPEVSTAGTPAPTVLSSNSTITSLLPTQLVSQSSGVVGSTATLTVTTDNNPAVAGMVEIKGAGSSGPVPPSITASPMTATFVLGDAAVSHPQAIVAAALTGTFSPGPMVVSAGPVLSASPLGATFGLGEASLTTQPALAVQVNSLAANFALGAASVSTQQLHQATFTLNLDSPAPEGVSVHWTTQDGTAVAGTDYTGGSGVLDFITGALSGTITIALSGASSDGKVFNLILSSPVGATFTGGVSSLPVPCPINIPGGGGNTPPPPTGLTALTAVGQNITDASGTPYIPRTCHLYGFESNLFPIGLFTRGYKTLTVGGVVNEGVLDQIKRFGFNGIRLSFCQDVTWTVTGPPTPDNPWTPANGRRAVQDGGHFLDPVLNPDLFTTTDPSQTEALPQPIISALEMMDKIVAYATGLGLRVILDMHTLAPNSSDVDGNSPGGDTTKKRWYTTADRLTGGGTTGAVGELRDETQCIAAWVAITGRYANNPGVCGADLVNEPAGGTWDTDPTANLDSNLPSFYERCGRAIHAVNPDIMIVCEGAAGNIDYGPFPGITDGTGGGANEYIIGTFWSGDLSGVADRQVTLDIPGKVIYSPHEYGSYTSVDAIGFLTAAQAASWGNPVGKTLSRVYFYDPTFPANMPAIWRGAWGFIAEQGIAPVWIGEIAAGLRAPNSSADQVAADGPWLTAFDQYARAHSIGFNWFCWNVEAGNGGIGLLEAYTDTEMHVQQKPLVDLMTAPPMLPTSSVPA